MTKEELERYREFLINELSAFLYDTNVTHDSKWILGSEEKLNEVV